MRFETGSHSTTPWPCFEVNKKKRDGTKNAQSACGCGSPIPVFDILQIYPNIDANTDWFFVLCGEHNCVREQARARHRLFQAILFTYYISQFSTASQRMKIYSVRTETATRKEKKKAHAGKIKFKAALRTLRTTKIYARIDDSHTRTPTHIMRLLSLSISFSLFHFILFSGSHSAWLVRVCIEITLFSSSCLIFTTEDNSITNRQWVPLLPVRYDDLKHFSTQQISILAIASAPHTHTHPIPASHTYFYVAGAVATTFRFDSWNFKCSVHFGNSTRLK